MRKSLPMRVLLLVFGLCFCAASGSALAQGDGAKAATEDLLSSVVRIKTYINPDGRTVENLGRERDGSGIVIDDSGLADDCVRSDNGAGENVRPRRELPHQRRLHSAG
mgnify:CR=1 FL=1